MSLPPPGNARPIRRRFAIDGRVRTGCLTCKARKKKCDEQHSAADDRCQSCARLGLVCERTPLRIITAKPRPRTRSKGEKRPSLSQLDLGKGQAMLVVVGGEPEGGDHHDGQVWGQGEEQEQDQDQGQEIGAGLIPALSSRQSAQRMLLQYYLEHLAPLCSILQQGSKNSFCTVLLPMAVVDSALLYALLSCAAVHISTSLQASDSANRLQRLEFESQAARALSEAINQNAVTESTIACALLSSTASVISGDRTRWSLHLQGAGLLIQHVGAQQLLRTPDGVFLLRNFAYHDIMAALSAGRHPLLRGAYWSKQGVVYSADCLMGLAHGIFEYISEICCFIADTKDNHDPQHVGGTSCGHCAQGEALAEALRGHHLGMDGDADLEPLPHHAEAFRHAALLHLYRFLRCCHGSRMYEAELGACTQEIVAHVSQVPAGVNCEGGLLFPLFMVGIAAWDDSELIEYVSNRLRFIEGWTGFKHVGRVSHLLQALWAQGRTDWEVLVEELGWRISLT